MGASLGSMRSPSAPASRFCSCKTSSRCLTSMRGRSGFSGLCTTRISSVTEGRWRERAWAIIDLPVPGGPTSKKMIAQALSRSEEHTSELQSRQYLVCRLLLEKKKKAQQYKINYTQMNSTHPIQTNLQTGNAT